MLDKKLICGGETARYRRRTTNAAVTVTVTSYY